MVSSNSEFTIGTVCMSSRIVQSAMFAMVAFGGVETAFADKL